MPMDDQKIAQAWRFAAQRHNGQRYPGQEKLPYLMHIGDVCLALFPALLANTQLDATTALCCAILHDTVEDTATTVSELASLFGKTIATGVAALSKDKTLHGLDATRDSLKRIRQQPYEIWAVKLADRTANMRIPPSHWSREKCMSYAEEGQVILDALREASPVLALALQERITMWYKQIA